MKEVVKDLKPMFYLVIVMWLIFIVSLVTPINNLGIHPRSLSGLIGIVLSPFLHANLGHITSNSLALLSFGFFFTMLNRDKALKLIVQLVIFSGILTWVIGGAGVHIGASGLVFGLFGYLLLAGIINKEPKHIIASILILVFYGGTIFGVFPSTPDVSWEGHLAGFVSGGLVAKIN